jgi:hypothetical protein
VLYNDFGAQTARFLKFVPDATGSYQLTSSNGTPSGSQSRKFTSFYDATHGKLYFMTPNSFSVVGLDGTFGPTTSPISTAITAPSGFDGCTTNGCLEYPYLVGTPGGETLFAAWTNVQNIANCMTAGGWCYLDDHFMASADGAAWSTPLGGAISMPVDPNDPATRITPQGDLDNVLQFGPDKGQNWLANIGFNGCQVHFLVWSSTMHYIRYDFCNVPPSQRKENLYVSSLRGETLTLVPNGAYFVDDPASGNLYAVGAMFVDGEQPYVQHTGALVSLDHGTTWHDYAASAYSVPESQALFYGTGGARTIASDGSIVGAFTEYRYVAPPHVIWSFRIVPVRP